jgi:hypothetical protein
VGARAGRIANTRELGQLTPPPSLAAIAVAAPVVSNDATLRTRTAFSSTAPVGRPIK